MKRKLFTALVLTAALTLAGCGCGKSEKPSSGSVSENAVSENTVSDNAVTEISVSDNAAEEVFDEETIDYTKLPAFTAKDLQGNEVTGDLIAGKEFTMVNVWGTYCPPCIGEMPDLEKLSQSLPENAQIVGLICDVTYQSSEETQKAIDICEKAGVTYTNIVLDESLLKFSSQFYYIPTTFFVDSEGKMIGDMIIGADLNSYVERLEELLPGWSYEG